MWERLYNRETESVFATPTGASPFTFHKVGLQPPGLSQTGSFLTGALKICTALYTLHHLNLIQKTDNLKWRTWQIATSNMQSVDNSTDGAQAYMARPARFLKILSNSVRTLQKSHMIQKICI